MLRDAAVAVFSKWLASRTRRQHNDLQVLPSLAGELLAEYGRHLWTEGSTLGVYVATILGTGDEFQFMRRSLGAAWDVVRSWKLKEPFSITPPV